MGNLTLKQNMFIDKYLETHSATQAAFIAYHCKNRNIAGVTGHRLLRNVNVRLAIDDILDRAGLSDEAQVQKLKSSFLASNNVKAIELIFKLRGMDI